MKTLLLSALIIACSFVSFAQENDIQPRHTISAQYGYGWFGLFNDTPIDIEADSNEGSGSSEYDATLSGSPAATIAYDYRFGRTFSLGGAVGYQALKFENFSGRATNEFIPGDVNVNRIFLSARTLFHYGRNPKWDLYSGVRTGITVWNIDSNVDIDEFSFGSAGASIGSASVVLPHLVPIPFGFKYYPSKNLMIGSELAFGSPHFIALQVGVRL